MLDLITIKRIHPYFFPPKIQWVTKENVVSAMIAKCSVTGQMTFGCDNGEALLGRDGL